MVELLNLIALLITLSAFFSYVNYRYLRLPTTIGVMLIALALSLGLIALALVDVRIAQYAQALLTQVDFSKALMHGMLSFLLFAGALHVNINDLARQRWVIGTMASVGVLAVNTRNPKPIGSAAPSLSILSASLRDAST